MTPRRTSPARLWQLNDQLGERDRLILGSLDRLRLATTRQLQRLHFTDSTPLANARAARRHLQRLAEDDLVTALERRVGGVRAGSGAIVWALGVAGQRLMDRQRRGSIQPRKPWTPSAPFVAHRLAIAELYVELVEASRATGALPGHFSAEPDCWRRFTGAAGPVTVKPDAYVVVAHADYDEAAFVEVDLATESLPVLANKCRVYVNYRRSGREQRAHGVFPWVVFSVPTVERRVAVERLFETLPQPERSIFRVSLAGETARLLLEGEP